MSIRIFSFGTVIYLAIGALCHALFYAAHFNFLNAWTWAWLIAWPLMLFFWVAVIGGVLAVLILAYLKVAEAFR